MKFGVEQYGSCRIHWQCEFDSLDKFDQLNQKLLKDREYLDMVKRTEGLWVHGILKDTLVKVPDGSTQTADNFDNDPDAGVAPRSFVVGPGSQKAQPFSPCQ